MDGTSSHAARAADTLDMITSQLGVLNHTCGLLEQRLSVIEDSDLQMQDALRLLVERVRNQMRKPLAADVEQVRRPSAQDVHL
mmetsp:Transcript_36652/g.107467  ORF Transcript_36652/g.107467 Transcript_36652/m.107467 type:complete len:83 (+) Transcript_36652:673-921(+)